MYTTSNPCTLCGSDLAAVRHSSYWEGGQGCRNKAKMSRQVLFVILNTLTLLIFFFIEMINTSTAKVAKRLLPNTLKELEHKEKRSQNSLLTIA